jgi:hypothetical protein
MQSILDLAVDAVPAQMRNATALHFPTLLPTFVPKTTEFYLITHTRLFTLFVECSRIFSVPLRPHYVITTTREAPPRKARGLYIRDMYVCWTWLSMTVAAQTKYPDVTTLDTVCYLIKIHDQPSLSYFKELCQNAHALPMLR